MNKAQLIKVIREELGPDASKQDAALALDATLNAIKKTVAREKVQIVGFGTFETIVRAEKLGRNISKNTSVVIPAHRIPKFKPCKEFVEQVKNNVK